MPLMVLELKLGPQERRCQCDCCPDGRSMGFPCPNEMTEEDLLCDWCRQWKGRLQEHCHFADLAARRHG